MKEFLKRFYKWPTSLGTMLRFYVFLVLCLCVYPAVIDVNRAYVPGDANPDDVLTAPAPDQQPDATGHKVFDGYDQFIAGLTRLVADLNDPEWEAQSAPVASSSSIPSYFHSSISLSSDSHSPSFLSFDSHSPGVISSDSHAPLSTNSHSFTSLLSDSYSPDSISSDSHSAAPSTSRDSRRTDMQFGPDYPSFGLLFHSYDSAPSDIPSDSLQSSSGIHSSDPSAEVVWEWGSHISNHSHDSISSESEAVDPFLISESTHPPFLSESFNPPLRSEAANSTLQFESVNSPLLGRNSSPLLSESANSDLISKSADPSIFSELTSRHHPLYTLFGIVSSMNIFSHNIQEKNKGDTREDESLRVTNETGRITDEQGRVYESIEEYQAMTFSTPTNHESNTNTNVTLAIQILSEYYQHYNNYSSNQTHNTHGLEELVDILKALSRSLLDFGVQLGDLSGSSNAQNSSSFSSSHVPGSSNLPAVSTVNQNVNLSSDFTQTLSGINDVPFSNTVENADGAVSEGSFDSGSVQSSDPNFVPISASNSVQSSVSNPVQSFFNSDHNSDPISLRRSDSSSFQSSVSNPNHSSDSTSGSFSALPPSESVHSSFSAPAPEYYGLVAIIEKLETLMKLAPANSSPLEPSPSLQQAVPMSTTITTTTTTTTTTSTPKEGYAPCEAPWEEVAYHMCILQEMTLRLSWEGAQRYCWGNGGELAEDSVVIKTRRFLNDLYGEEGSRVRWPIWVGGKKSEDGEWRWRSGSQVLNFLWTLEQPRDYPPTLAPQGTCMLLDGYQRFYGASLPCHLKRRFVCQRLE